MKHIVSEALSKVPPVKRAEYQHMFDSKKVVIDKPLINRPNHKIWAMTDFSDLEGQLIKRDRVNGNRVLKEAACLACHTFNGYGQAVGPDLTNIGARFDVKTILESIIDPSKIIADKYKNISITNRNGELIEGRLIGESGDSLFISTSSSSASQLREVKLKAIATRNDSKYSPMPSGLMNSFTKDEIFDLLALLQLGPKK